MPEVLSKCNPDIERERKKCTFSTKELTIFLDKGEDKVQERKALGNYYNYNDILYSC